MEIAHILTKQLAKFVTLRRYQLAGHVANFDFWMAEVRHALAVIGGYKTRFEKMRTAQRALQSGPFLTRLPHDEMDDAKAELRDVCYRLLTRCVREQLLSEAALRELCVSLDISVDARNLR